MLDLVMLWNISIDLKLAEKKIFWSYSQIRFTICFWLSPFFVLVSQNYSNFTQIYPNLLKFYSKSPLSATKISERHDILYNTVGYLPEEQTAYVYVWIIAGISIPLLILSTILEVFLSITYNETVHPFRNIVVDIKPNAEEQNFPLNLINPM